MVDRELRTHADPCLSCNATLVKQTDWNGLSKTEYRVLRSMGLAKYGAHRMCDTCYTRARRADAHANNEVTHCDPHHCGDCHRIMIPQRAWNVLPIEARNTLIEQGFAKQATTSECAACYTYGYRHRPTAA